MSYEILTDTGANLTDELIEKFGIQVMSLVFVVDGKEYKSYEKGKKTDLSKFYVMMREGKVITTSCVNADTANENIRAIFERGNDILYIGFSSGLSATYETVCAAAEEIKKEYPDRKMISVDSLAAALGQGLLVTYAAEMREQGKSLEEVASWLEENKLHLCHWFTVEDLKYLKRGGRISAAAALFGGMLNIKPVMHVDDFGHLVPVAKVRGTRKAIDMMIEKMKESILPNIKQKIYIVHADYMEGAKLLAEKVKKAVGIEDILIHQVDPVIGAHSGPGTLALFFLGNKR